MRNNKDKAAAETDIAAPRLVVMIVYDGVEILDVAGPASVFSKANVYAPGTYDFRVLASRAGNAVDSSGIPIAPHGSWKALGSETVDTLIVAGGPGLAVERELADGELAQWLAAMAPRVRRMVSVCTGAFALGAAGLLDDRCATTHWEAVEHLQACFPASQISNDTIYVQDGNVWTSAGILTGIDLALALVEADLGRSCALHIGSLLVLAGMRSGDSPQKSALLASQAQASHPIRELLSWIRLNLTERLTLDVMAARMGMSDRHFRRVFQAETGLSPTRYVTSARLDYAAQLLRNTSWNVESVAMKSGFESVDALQRGFIKRWRQSPTEFRANGAAAH